MGAAILVALALEFLQESGIALQWGERKGLGTPLPLLLKEVSRLIPSRGTQQFLPRWGQ
jgi:hypothetical protein